jgi:hypothetical protein
MDSFDVKRLQNIAYVNSRIVSAQIEMEAMKTFNQDRLNRGEQIGYTEESFLSLIDKYGLGNNTILTELENGL